MATVSKWTPFGVALDLTATGGSVVRKSATQFTVTINASWETYYSGAQTNYGMTAASGGVTKTISAFDGTKRSQGSTSFTGTYSISGNGAATKTITVTFRNFNTDNGDSASKNVTFNVSVPAWTSYKVTYNANGGSGAPSAQTKWRDQTLTLSSTKPTRTGYSFLGWAASANAPSATYSAGGSYTANAAVTLYAVWKANTYTVKYDANGGSGAPANQTKTYGKTLTLSSTEPGRTNYNFLGWSTSASSTSVAYTPGASYTANAAVTLYAVWQLAYVKPRISNVSTVRCNSSGTPVDDGQNGLVSFNWECDKDLTSIVIKWKLPSETSWKSVTVSASGKSGTVKQVIGSNVLNVESSYDIHITVTDSNGSSYAIDTLMSMKFAIDFLAGGKGCAFGKTAELDNIADFEFKARFRNNFTVDSEWVNLTLDADFKCYNDLEINHPRYKVSGNVVTVIGAVSPLVGFTSSATPVTFASGIPAQYRPQIGQIFVCQGSGMNRWECQVRTSGELTVARYGITEATTVSNTAWLPFSCTYQI